MAILREFFFRFLRLQPATGTGVNFTTTPMVFRQQHDAAFGSFPGLFVEINLHAAISEKA